MVIIGVTSAHEPPSRVQGLRAQGPSLEHLEVMLYTDLI